MDFEVDFKVDLEFGFSSHPMQGNPRRSWILDSTLWISGFQYWIPHFFKIGTWISDSNRLWDSGFIELDSGFQSPGFRITQTNLFRTPDSSSKSFHPYMGWCEKYASCFRSKGFVHYSSLLHLQFRYRCHLCGCGRLRVDETLPINKWFE